MAKHVSLADEFTVAIDDPKHELWKIADLLNELQSGNMRTEAIAFAFMAAMSIISDSMNDIIDPEAEQTACIGRDLAKHLLECADRYMEDRAKEIRLN